MSERDDLVETAATAFRSRDVSGAILPNPAWADLDAEGRREAHAVATQARILEAALDPEGLSTTARAVLERIANAR